VLLDLNYVECVVIDDIVELVFWLWWRYVVNWMLILILLLMSKLYLNSGDVNDE